MKLPLLGDGGRVGRESKLLNLTARELSGQLLKLPLLGDGDRVGREGKLLNWTARELSGQLLKLPLLGYGGRVGRESKPQLDSHLYRQLMKLKLLGAARGF